MSGTAPPAKKAAAAVAPKRRGPGRPPSKPPAPSLERKGVVDTPDDPNNRLEFAFGDPSMFKALYTYFKNIKARELHLRCSPSGLTFFTRDHVKRSRVIVYIAGEHVNWYYCESTFWLGLNRDGIDKLFASIDRTFYKITITQSHDDIERLNIIFQDPVLDKDCNYGVTLSAYPADEDLFEAEALLDPERLATLYPLEFTLTAKQFKKSVSDASNYTETIAYEKIGKHPFQMTYTKANLTYNEVYRSDEKIQLRASIPEGSTFRCSIKVADLKSLAASMVTDDVRILCSETSDLLCRSAIDAKALVVNTLTQLA
jgi:hypothetical protein